MKNELHHHGILGMKWGVRRNLQEKRRAAARRAKKIKKKVSSMKVKPQKKNSRQKLDNNIKRSVRLNEENKFMNFADNRMLSRGSRKECAKIFKNRENYSYNELQKLSNKYQEEANISNALYQRTKKKTDMNRTLAKAAVNYAFDGELKYISNPVKKAIESTDRTKTSDQVRRDMLSASLQSLANYAKDNGMDVKTIAKEYGDKYDRK